MSDMETSATCSGCEKEINLLETHLSVVVKPQRKAFVMPVVEQRKATTAHEDDSEPVTLGVRSGVGEQLFFHDNGCVVEYFRQKKDDAVKLTYNRDNSDPYKDSAGGDDE